MSTNLISISKSAPPSVNIEYSTLEKVLLNGDLSELKPNERMMYYSKTCQSLGLNPLTRPFEYLKLNNKLTLYARKDATDQLRKIHNISVTSISTEVINDIYIVTVKGKSNSKEDIATGAVNIKGLAGDNLANAMMKAETKAKRRLTLSIAGLGMIDETEIETIKDAKVSPASDEELEMHLDNIKLAQTEEELKVAFKEAYKQFSKSPELLEMITEVKDKRKSVLSKALEEHQDFINDTNQ